MRAEFAYEEAQKYLRQRNRLAVVAGVLGLASLLGLGAAATRDREVVLVPVTSERLSLTSAGPDTHYLELVTRDTALMLLNRSPQGLDYWMGEILKLADPAAHGRLKGELVKIVEEQRGSDISQAFVIRRMDVDPGSLTSTVTGTLKTFVGAQVIASNDRSFRLSWSRRGLSLALTGFEQLPDPSQKD
ncbi:type IV conjugative transfer system protein TraE [Novosphingobium panipatense]|uniref:Conjugal transfer pilus assembly protein TraE n=1 Tax=Novosphingobium panipatense TaxID=428991 RepID=A0ABY1Q5S7_9SPHN|nr:type IV conjugative transfer system protein TraE [Novosphingobium panipatense]SMP60394.1 conjugal transfer pilus assembly protein TraE [Novosphingobium panipatense]|tara:strand:- start:94 stop:657 length:564 start_codon:yes stop_codon:yes gene_type:complete